MAEIESPEVRVWHDALEALRAINRMKPPDVLFANRQSARRWACRKTRCG
jgi:hypothetical protein